MIHTIVYNLLLLFGRNIRLETGLLAKQSYCEVRVSMGNTMLLASYKEVKEDVDILPLTVNYRLNYSAVVKTPGVFIKREGRAVENEDEILTMIVS